MAHRGDATSDEIRDALAPVAMEGVVLPVGRGNDQLWSADGLGWERPAAHAASSSATPPHIRKMARRYDTLRAMVLKASRPPPGHEGASAVATPGGSLRSNAALTPVAEEGEDLDRHMAARNRPHANISSESVPPTERMLLDSDDETGPGDLAAQEEANEEPPSPFRRTSLGA